MCLQTRHLLLTLLKKYEFFTGTMNLVDLVSCGTLGMVVALFALDGGSDHLVIGVKSKAAKCVAAEACIFVPGLEYGYFLWMLVFCLD